MKLMFQIYEKCLDYAFQKEFIRSIATPAGPPGSYVISQYYRRYLSTGYYSDKYIFYLHQTCYLVLPSANITSNVLAMTDRGGALNATRLQELIQRYEKRYNNREDKIYCSQKKHHRLKRKQKCESNKKVAKKERYGKQKLKKNAQEMLTRDG